MTRALDLDLAAVALEAVAARVALALDEVVAHHRPDVWSGVRATRFGAELDDQRLAVRALADDLRVESRILRTRADLLRAAEALAP